MNPLLSPLLMIMAALLIGVVIKSLQKYIRIPYTVVLFAIGLAIGYMYKYDFLGAGEHLGAGIRLVSDMNPDFILYVLLPVLVFDTAYEMDLHVFNRTLLNSSILAGPGVVICMLLTGGLVMLIANLLGVYENSLWKYALMFGGLISATDPIAVVALLKELGTSRRFSTLVDGEALLNDGTGIVCFMLFYSQFDGSGAIDRPFLFFVWVCLASCVIGYVMAKLALWFTIKVCTQEVVQNLVMIAAAYLTFILAQKTLSVSGVIALVAFGYMFAHNGKTRLKPGVNEFMGKFWGLMTEIANTLIFLIVGVVIATQVNLGWLDDLALFQGQPVYMRYIFAALLIFVVYVGLNVIRYIMIAVLYPALKHSGYGLSFREGIILGWSGLRGAVAMTLALMVNCNPLIPESIRGAILLLTAGTITLTLCINATTSKSMVRKLGLNRKVSGAEDKVMGKVVDTVRRRDLELIDKLKSDPEYKGVEWSGVMDRIMPEYVSAFKDAADDPDAGPMLSVLRVALAQAMFSCVETEYGRGLVSHRAFLRLNDAFALFRDFEGSKSIADLEIGYLSGKKPFFRSRRKHTLLVLNSCHILAAACDGGRAFLASVNELHPAVDSNRKQGAVPLISEELDALDAKVGGIMQSVRNSEPEIYKEFLCRLAEKLVLAFERETIDGLCSSNLLSPEQADSMKSDTDVRQGIEIYD